ncbi:hypothetical protein ABW19_dt0202943 [Dactylella cylindrospora]|nr:hypothetical protein ABW19_dt0202943 [Dactylella cylindrospora]
MPSITTPRVILLASLPLAHAFLKSSSKPKKPPTLFARVLPVIVLLTVLGALAVILYLVYKTVVSVSKEAQHKLDDNHIKLSKSGAEVEVKGVSYEEYRDLTQKAVVNAWNNSETKDYHSRLWGPRDDKHREHSLKKRPSYVAFII